MNRARTFMPLLLLFLMLLPGSAAAAEGVDAIVDRLQRRYEAVTTITADFTQAVYSKGFQQQPQVSGGRVYFKKPGKMKWLYQKDAKDELVSNGKTIWFFQPDLNQAVQREIESSMSSISVDFLSGVGSLREDFSVKVSGENGGNGEDGGVYDLELKPTHPQPNVRRLFITVDRKAALIVKTSVEDHFGNRTEVSFKNIKLNAPLKDSFFEWTAPKGVKVIKQ